MMMLGPDEMLEVLRFLSRSQLEQLQPCNRSFHEIIDNSSKLLPLRPFFCIECQSIDVIWIFFTKSDNLNMTPFNSGNTDVGHQGQESDLWELIGQCLQQDCELIDITNQVPTLYCRICGNEIVIISQQQSSNHLRNENGRNNRTYDIGFDKLNEQFMPLFEAHLRSKHESIYDHILQAKANDSFTTSVPPSFHIRAVEIATHPGKFASYAPHYLEDSDFQCSNYICILNTFSSNRRPSDLLNDVLANCFIHLLDICSVSVNAWMTLLEMFNREIGVTPISTGAVCSSSLAADDKMVVVKPNHLIFHLNFAVQCPLSSSSVLNSAAFNNAAANIQRFFSILGHQFNAQMVYTYLPVSTERVVLNLAQLQQQKGIAADAVAIFPDIFPHLDLQQKNHHHIASQSAAADENEMAAALKKLIFAKPSVAGTQRELLLPVRLWIRNEHRGSSYFPNGEWARSSLSVGPIAMRPELVDEFIETFLHLKCTEFLAWRRVRLWCYSFQTSETSDSSFFNETLLAKWPNANGLTRVRKGEYEARNDQTGLRICVIFRLHRIREDHIHIHHHVQQQEQQQSATVRPTMPTAVSSEYGQCPSSGAFVLELLPTYENDEELNE